MAIISSFLCWSNTRTGSAVCGYYTLVISVVCLAFYMLRYIALDEIKDSIELKGIVYAGFVLYSFLIGVSLILLPGVYMDRKFLLLPWIYVLVITVLYETGAIALITTVHLEKDHTLSPWEIVAVVFYCIRLVANCYCFACVVSQYQELSEGRGTYEFLFKPRRRHMARGAPVSDLDEYHPPYGASLPPYSEVNLYKEYCPPSYENLALEGDGRRWDTSHYGLSAIGAVGRGGPHSHRLRGAVSTSCLAEVHVNTPPPGFEDIEICGEDRDYESISSVSSFHHHRLRQNRDDNNHQYLYLTDDNNEDGGHHYLSHSNSNSNNLNFNQNPNRHHHHRRHQHHHRHQHYRHHSLPQTHHSQYDYDSTCDDNSNNNNNNNNDNDENNRSNNTNHNRDFVHHQRHRSAGSKPIITSSPIEVSRRLPDYNDLHLNYPPVHNLHTTHLDTHPSSTPSTRSGSSTPDNTSSLPPLGKEPITMTTTSGFLSFSQTDFRTPTPKSSPALSVHSCHRINNSGSRSPPAIHKRTYITWI